jgi:hypothetical protein
MPDQAISVYCGHRDSFTVGMVGAVSLRLKTQKAEHRLGLLGAQNFFGSNQVDPGTGQLRVLTVSPTEEGGHPGDPVRANSLCVHILPCWVSSVQLSLQLSECTVSKICDERTKGTVINYKRNMKRRGQTGREQRIQVKYEEENRRRVVVLIFCWMNKTTEIF